MDGTLHCSSDEAIVLAGLQFRTEKLLEQNNRTPDSLAAVSPDSLLDGGGPCSVLQPISEDKEHYLQLDVPGSMSSGSPPRRPADDIDDAVFNVATSPTSPTVTDEPSTWNMRDFFLCMCPNLFGRPDHEKTVPERDPFGIMHNMHLYMPPNYRDTENAVKMLKVSEAV